MNEEKNATVLCLPQFCRLPICWSAKGGSVREDEQKYKKKSGNEMK